MTESAPTRVARLVLPAMITMTFLVASMGGGSSRTAFAAGSQAFSFTGARQSFTVPAGVSEVQVYVRGASGGSIGGGGTNGLGAYVSAVLTVTPGETLYLYVGERGFTANTSGTFGGGGAAGGGVQWATQGGGGSDIRRGWDGSTGSGTGFRVVVAGGGGGAGSGWQADGGNGGTPNGAAGGPATTANYVGQGGAGGTQSAGGAGGPGNPDCSAVNGSNGQVGAGGRGGNANYGNGWFGSGGGGGYYGGGGGGAGCSSGGGGGGSSYADPAQTSGVSYALANSFNNGCIEIAWPAGTAASACTGAAPVTTTTSSTTTTTTTSTTTTTTSTTTTTTSTTTTTTSTTTTTTVAPSTSSSTTSSSSTTTSSTTSSTSSSSTTSPAQATTTVAPSTTVQGAVLSGSTTSTVVAPVATNSAPAVTTTLPPTTTTSPALSTSTTVPAPQAAPAEPGAAAMLVNGQVTALTVSRQNNAFKISGADLSLTLKVFDENGAVVPLDPDGNINGNQGDSLDVDLSGARPGVDISVWIFSTPVRIGGGTISDGGGFSSRFAIPDDVESGKHRVVVNTVSYTGSESTLSVGFLMGSDGDGTSPIGVIIFTTLGIAAAAALIIPATRRRRRRLESA